MQLKINLKISKKTALVAMATILFIGLGTLLYLKHTNSNPLPDKIKSQLNYKVIYPSNTGQIDPNSYSFQTDQKSLSFKVNSSGNIIVFTEQPAPQSLGSGQPYYPALGLHPYAQFNTELGPVALVKFYKTDSLEPAGQSGILARSGTLLIAHSAKSLTNAQWKNLFDSLKISK